MPQDFMSTDEIRSQFAEALSAMYRKEVPAYNKLLSLVHDTNKKTLQSIGQDAIAADVAQASTEHHGAIRLGNAEELNMMRRMLAVMGMHPVSYYDLSQAGIPVHSTAFRPMTPLAMQHNPFRLFTSLIRLELIADTATRQLAEGLLQQRQLFTPEAQSLLETAEQQGGLNTTQSQQFIQQLLTTFRWHNQATADYDAYQKLSRHHRLLADVVCFKSAHINHLTPRILDIDSAHQAMSSYDLDPKAIIEGPPLRQCPILLRQTSFKALSEKVINLRNPLETFTHKARFGEIEQRGIALTPKGRALYDQLLSQARSSLPLAADGSNHAAYMDNLQAVFSDFPDDWATLHQQALAYFDYRILDASQLSADTDLEQWLQRGAVEYRPIVYEDFLPVSAAGIFQSNLGDTEQKSAQQQGNQAEFEQALGCPVLDEFTLYAEQQTQSLRAIKTLTRLHSHTSSQWNFFK